MHDAEPDEIVHPLVNQPDLFAASESIVALLFILFASGRLRPAMRIMKNSSMFALTIARNLSRSASGCLSILRQREHPALKREQAQLRIQELATIGIQCRRR